MRLPVWVRLPTSARSVAQRQLLRSRDGACKKRQRPLGDGFRYRLRCGPNVRRILDAGCARPPPRHRPLSTAWAESRRGWGAFVVGDRLGGINILPRSPWTPKGRVTGATTLVSGRTSCPPASRHRLVSGPAVHDPRLERQSDRRALNPDRGANVTVTGRGRRGQ